jgi:hypothetical protein
MKGISKLKHLYVLGPLFLFLCSFVVMDVYKSSGGHPSSTGAPGEATCADATVGCHTNASVTKDSTNVVNSLTFSSGDSTYEPGKTYTVIVSAQKTGIERFGFEIVALTKSNANTGAWKITDGNRTHTLLGSGNLADRKYVTHSISGTPPVSAGLGQWSFDWTAPATNVGDITFYYATNCTNNNSTAAGDALFLSSFRIRPSGAVSVTNAEGKIPFKVSYQNASRTIVVNYQLKQQGTVVLGLYDLQGKLLRELKRSEKKPGKISESFSLSNAIPSGIYLVQMTIGNLKMTEKIIVQ